MSDKLGFTFYPKDWWTSESYFELSPLQRYYYLECLFIMYSNEGLMKTQKTQFENRTRTQVETQDWEIVVSKFKIDKDCYTHESVNKRLRKAIANRENGKLGGRPPKPKEPKKETQKNPPLERERENEEETEKNIKTKNDFIYDELIISESWLESVSMNSQLKFSIIEVRSFLKKYNTTINNDFDFKINKSDYCSHFTRWLNKQQKNKTDESITDIATRARLGTLNK